MYLRRNCEIVLNDSTKGFRASIFLYGYLSVSTWKTQYARMTPNSGFPIAETNPGGSTDWNILQIVHKFRIDTMPLPPTGNCS